MAGATAGGFSIGSLFAELGLRTDSFDAGIGRAMGALQKAGQQMQSIGTRFTAALTVPLTGAGLGALKLASDVEQVEVALTTMLGSAEKAGSLLKEIQQFAASTPFQFPELQRSAKSLLAFGIASEKILPTLRRIGDVSAGISAPIGEIAQIYGKARVQGRLFAEDINQLTGRGIPIIQELAKQFGVAESEVKKLVESGAVTFTNLEKAFVDLTSEGGKFAGLMEAQSQTLSGLWSTMVDNISLGLTELGKDIIETFDLKTVIQNVSSGIQRAVGAFKSLAPETRKTIILVGGLAAAAGPLLVALGGIVTIAPAVGAAFTAMTGPVGLTIAAVAALGAGILYLVDNWEAVKERISDWSWWRNTLIDMAQFVIEYNPMSLFIKPYQQLLKLLDIELPNPFEGIADSLEALKVPTKEYDHEFKGFTESIIGGAKKAAKAVFNILPKAEVAKQQAEEVAEAVNEELAKVGTGVKRMASVPTLEIAPILDTKALQDELKNLPMGGEIKMNLNLEFQGIQMAELLGTHLDVLQERASFVEDKIRSLTATFGTHSPQVQAAVDQWMALKEQMDHATHSIQLGEQAAGFFSDTFSQLAASGETSLKALTKAVLNSAREFIAAQLAQGVAAALKNALAGVPFPFNIIAAGAAAGAAAGLFNKLVPKFAQGGIVPPGFPNDTYPALLSSGETVIPSPHPLPAMGGRGQVIENIIMLDGNMIYKNQKEVEYRKHR